MTVINSLRNHPYDNAIRTSFTSNESNPVKNQQTLLLNNQDNYPSFTHMSTTNSTTTNVNPNKNLTKNSLPSFHLTHLNRNSSSNAILAQLKSISPNFKSIFVRPKNSKHIDSSAILNKVKMQSKYLSDDSTASSHKNTNSMASILNFLYTSSPSSVEEASNRNYATQAQYLLNKNKNIKNHYLTDSSRFINILPNTEPKELRLNGSVDELLKKFSNESKSIFSLRNLQKEDNKK